MANRTHKKNRGRAPQIPFFGDSGKKYYYDRLKWLLNFLNEDIEKLPPGGFLKLFYEFLSFLYADYVDEEKLKRVCSDTKEDREQLKKVQETLDSLLTDLQYRIHYSKRLESNPALIEDQMYKEISEEINKRTIWKDDDDLDKIPLTYEMRGERIVLVPEIKIYEYANLINQDEKETVQSFLTHHESVSNLIMSHEVASSLIKSRGHDAPVDFGKFNKFCDPKLEVNLKFGLFKVMEKFPISIIYRCAGCSKYFIKNINKTSDYCTKCIKKKHIYKWRERNRDEYNVYQRNLQKGVKTSIKDIRIELDNNKNQRDEKER